MPCSSASSTALRVALRSPAAGFGAGFSSALASIDASSSADSATYAIVLPSSTSTSSPYSCTIVPAPGASTSTVAFVVSTTQTGWPAVDLGAVLDEPLCEEGVLGVRVLAREDDLEH